MTLPFQRTRTAIGVAVAIVLAAAVAVALLVRNGPPASTACAGTPTSSTVIRVPGQRATAHLTVYLHPGQACATVNGPSYALVGVELEACTNAAGPDLPGQCASTADTLDGHQALHQTGTTTITTTTPTRGYVIARGYLGNHSQTGTAAIKVTITPAPSQTPTPLPRHRGVPGPRVTSQPPTTAAA